MLATSPDVIVPFRGQRRHKRAIVSQSDFLERRHNIAVEAILRIHDDNVAKRVACDGM